MAEASLQSTPCRRIQRHPVGSDGADGWTPIADLPDKTTDNVAENIDDTLYSGFGFDGTATVSTLYTYDPATGAWTQKASGKDERDAPAHGVIDGKIYVVGGWSQQATVDSSMEVYDPATDTWSAGVTAPAGYAGAASAVLGGKLYTVGGCTNLGCGTTDAWSFDPKTGTWQQVADYPEGTSRGAPAARSAASSLRRRREPGRRQRPRLRLRRCPVSPEGGRLA